MRVGRFPDAAPAMACADCAEALVPTPMATVVAFPAR